MSEAHNDDLTDWMRQYGTGLRRYFSRRANEAEVDDLVQEVFVHLQAKQRNTAIVNPQGYTFTVARNVLINHYRRQQTRSGTFQESFAGDIEVPDFISPERTAIGVEEYRRVVQAILNLPPRARAAFLFHRFENMTYKAIAKRMNISKESVKELIQRALVQIRLDRGE